LKRRFDTYEEILDDHLIAVVAGLKMRSGKAG
jgi:hypothetical protein